MVPVIIEQHAAEAAFLWRLRSSAVTEPHYDLAALLVLDERVEANLDGLRLAGDAGWELCEDALGGGDPGAAFAATVVAADHPERFGRVLDMVSSGEDPELRRALVSALGWLEPHVARRVLPGLLQPAAGRARHLLGISALAAHRLDPGPELDYALYSDDPRLRARALRAVGEIGRPDLHPEVKRHLASDDDETRFAAAWTLALIGDRDGADVLAAIAEIGGPRAPAAAALALRRLGTQSAISWGRRAAEMPGCERIALLGAGASGDPQLVPYIIRCMETPELARAAGEAFTTITGADLEREGLRGAAPEGFEAGPNDDPADENVAQDPDQNLPWPDVMRLSAWWRARRDTFLPGMRHLLGCAVETQWLQRVLRGGYQRQRRAAALELVQTAQRGPFEVRAPAFRQWRQLQ